MLAAPVVVVVVVVVVAAAAAVRVFVGVGCGCWRPGDGRWLTLFVGCALCWS